MSDRIIKIGDTMYYIKGTMDVERAQGRGTEYWKQQWGVDSVLQNKHGDRQGISCSVNGGVREHLIKNGYEPEYGARPVKRLIRRDILSEVSKYMLEHPESNSIHVDYDDGVLISER